jgi:hypothetical protein
MSAVFVRMAERYVRAARALRTGAVFSACRRSLANDDRLAGRPDATCARQPAAAGLARAGDMRVTRSEFQASACGRVVAEFSLGLDEVASFSNGG